ncbi:MAG: type II toxin-antitoxin system RelB/DinJ family antitoxin [Propionibacteriaceae bacterium]|jgi:addiction module RelB/DinJ family antitoxin|nr:type II toxin-antitoxin system RelB/DinJ family antitoxin [Propionibacteriaceae bacterium]
MATQTVQKAYRVDAGLYEEVEDALFKMGISVPQAITMLFRRVVMEQRLPFTPAVVKSARQVETEQRIGELTGQLPTKVLNLTDPADVDTFYAP